MRRRGWVFLVLVFAWWGTAVPASATIIEALSLPDLTREADHIVLAECVSEAARYDEFRRIVTDYTVRVIEVEKGGARTGQTLVMRRIGGGLGDLGMHIEGEPHLVTGSRYLLFLRAGDAGTPLRPVGMSQGVMRLDGAMLQPGGGGLTLRERVSGGQLVPAPPALLWPEPYTDVRDRVRAAVGR